MSPLRALAPGNPLARLLLLVVIACVASSTISGVISGSIIKSGIDAAAAVQKAKLFNAQVGVCKRQNIARAATDENSLSSWKLNTLFVSAVAAPQPRASKKEQQLTHDFHLRLQELVATLVWTPLNHECSLEPAAVDLPIAFSSRQPSKAERKSWVALTKR